MSDRRQFQQQRFARRGFDQARVKASLRRAVAQGKAAPWPPVRQTSEAREVQAAKEPRHE